MKTRSEKPSKNVTTQLELTIMAVPCEMLLYPELLTNEQLISIIQERYLRVENIGIMPRDELLELFRHYCVPYGQRKYRDTGRGKVLNRTRHFSPEPTPRLQTINYNHNSKDSQLKRERLKPPPEALTGQMKRIKLDNNVNTDPVNNTKRKMSIDALAAGNDISPPKKDRKAITWP